MFSVQKPREQVADAEALLDIANTLVTSVKSQINDGLTPSNFVTALLRNYGQHGGDASLNTISWADVGLSISDVLRMAPGCCTMYKFLYPTMPFCESLIILLLLCLSLVLMNKDSFVKRPLMVIIFLLYRIGPMDAEMKLRKVSVHRKKTKPTESARPEEVSHCIYFPLFSLCNIYIENRSIYSHSIGSKMVATILLWMSFFNKLYLHLFV